MADAQGWADDDGCIVIDGDALGISIGELNPVFAGEWAGDDAEPADSVVISDSGDPDEAADAAGNVIDLIEAEDGGEAQRPSREGDEEDDLSSEPAYVDEATGTPVDDQGNAVMPDDVSDETASEASDPLTAVADDEEVEAI